MGKKQQPTESAEEQFLRELSDLSKKHGLKIGGCGCCGSPWIVPMTNPERQRGGYGIEQECDGTLKLGWQ